MKKVGIITLFHGSMNYGGVLQACALCKALEQLEIPSEQIRCVYIEQEPPQRLGADAEETDESQDCLEPNPL